MITALHERAVRNVPFSGALWVSYMRALERAGKPMEEVNGNLSSQFFGNFLIVIFEQALVSGLQSAEDYWGVFLGYINYVRRQSKLKSNAYFEFTVTPVQMVF
jgi:hypothetical protein